MKLYLKQRLFSWGDKFSVYGEDGEEDYFVQGEVFSWGKKLHIYDRNECEVAFIQQKLFSFRPRYEILQNGIPFAEVIKEFTFFKPKFSIDYNGWQVDGDWFEWDYKIFSSAGQSIATISKEILNWTDTYVIDVINPQDAVYVLMLVLAIDAEKCSRKD